MQAATKLEHPRIDDEAFELLSRLVQRIAGIHLPAPKRTLVEARLGRRVRALGLRSFVEYYQQATASEVELTHLIDSICTHETRFFREAGHFTFVRERAIPHWKALTLAQRRPARVRAWSAACSTGEEPFSLAMLLTAELPPDFVVEVLATDLSTRVLAQAREGEWSIERAGQIPDEYLKRFMLRGTGEHHGRMRASKLLRERVRFERRNLHEDAGAGGPHDLIFCCNVLIYFTAETRRAVLKRLLGQLAPDGLLFLGSAEMADPSLPLRKVGPNAYAHAGSDRW
jgi:chemotaxis protein methyltransferase CheR